MTRRLWVRPAALLILLTAFVGGIAFAYCDRFAVPPDEALARTRIENGGYVANNENVSLGSGASPGKWEAAAKQLYLPASLDYFEEMDVIGTTAELGAKPIKMNEKQIIGRNAWVLWAAGNEAWWDWVARNGYGTIDLLRLVDHLGRETRFERTGTVNEPGTREPTDEETGESHGVRYARPVTPEQKTKDGKVHVEHRTDKGSDWHPADYKVYGYPSGVVGLRLFKNPEFTAAAAKRWNPQLYYDDSPAGRSYAARPDTIRPFRVGMSCGFCHISPHPLNPPADKEFPEWANLSNNIGNQFLRVRAVFGNRLTPDNYLYHVFDSQLPGAVDTSAYPSDNISNPNTINSFFGLRGRLDRAERTPTEKLSLDTFNYIFKYENENNKKFENPHHVPRVLLDGSDSVGAQIALSRVYLNIGTHHQQWIRVQNPLLGFRKQQPFKLNDVAENSLYWHATLLRVKPMIEFFKVSTDPMRLKDAKVSEKTPTLLKDELRGTGLPWYTLPKKEEPKPADPKSDPKKEVPAPPAPEKDPPIVGGAGDYAVGRAAFAKGCVACHSSVQPGDVADLEADLPDVQLPRPKGLADRFVKKNEKGQPINNKGEVIAEKGGEPIPVEWKVEELSAEDRTELALARRSLRLTADDRMQLTRGNGTLPPGYALWGQQAVNRRMFWERTVTEDGRPVVVHNFLSIDERIPVTVTRTNSARAAATNALHGNVWEDFASETFKELAPVGPIQYRDPFSGAQKTYSPPGGGPGYYRVPTLISIWATAPFLHNNALGTFNNDPSVKGRLESFDDSISRLLWPERRRMPSKQHYWDGTNPSRKVDDAWYPGRESDKATNEKMSADQRDADSGWIWRTTEESWLRFDGPHVPQLVGGILNVSEFWRHILPWLPALAFLILGFFLLASESTIRFRERYFGWLWWLLAPVWWVLAAGGLVGGVLVGILVYDFWPMVKLLDIGTMHSIWGLRWMAVVLPVVLFASLTILFSLYRIRDVAFRRRLGRYAGVTCLVFAAISAIGVGRFLAGYGAGVKLGPIPEGTPINTIASFDPSATREQKLAALDALTTFFLKYQKVGPKESAGDKEKRRLEFEATVGPKLLDASKCPDYVTDRGHDYEFMRRLSDEEKRELIALLKTF
ncbi:MAG: hypothetical protein K8U57_38105 [Planctomycetes bacterium]|nr:hypothetical protein [Planctomycetota bacterium]